MRPTTLAAAALTAALLSIPTSSQAQAETGCWFQGATREEAAERPSPPDSALVTLGGQTVKLCYGAPSARGRVVMGGLIPWGEPWRAGANEATVIHMPFAAEVAGVRVEPGSYSIYVIPEQQSWTVAVNRNVHRWGIPLNEAVTSADVGRGTLAVETTASSLDRLTYTFERTGDDSADLLLEWERTRIRIPVRRVSS